MKIKKSYDKNINLGNYQTARIGITLEKELPEKISKAKIKEVSNALLEISKEIVNNELENLKEEEEIKNGRL